MAMAEIHSHTNLKDKIRFFDNIIQHERNEDRQSLISSVKIRPQVKPKPKFVPRPQSVNVTEVRQPFQVHLSVKPPPVSRSRSLHHTTEENMKRKASLDQSARTHAIPIQKSKSAIVLDEYLAESGVKLKQDIEDIVKKFTKDLDDLRHVDRCDKDDMQAKINENINKSDIIPYHSVDIVCASVLTPSFPKEQNVLGHSSCSDGKKQLKGNYCRVKRRKKSKR